MSIAFRLQPPSPLRFGLVIACLGLAGCPPSEAVRDLVNDGVPCGSLASARAVYIEVSYAPDGTPAVMPDTCTVDSGTRITWRGPDATPVPFEIRFKQASPVEDAPRGLLPAESRDDGRYVVSRTVAGSGTYPYAVRANGRELDPAIIIR